MGSLCVLIVDDNWAAADSLAMLVEMSGYEVYIAYDGLAAVSKAAEVRPDVVLLDLDLPDITGYEAARRIREQDKDKNLFLVALTGWTATDDRKTSEFDAFITKPVKYPDLEKLIREGRKEGV